MIPSDTATGYTGYGFDGGSIPGYLSPQYSGGGTVVLGNTGGYYVPFEEQPIIDLVPSPTPVTSVMVADTKDHAGVASVVVADAPDYTLWIVGGVILLALVLTSGGSR
ncbi:MAG: hypothetical protein KF736_09905 [Acidobacteria bacterium]|nr:hypothetical protein [Acidobacteriota bacterium]MCW5949829.1 hypothetical protein [Pyrinomonadaceae bacterium]